MKEIVKIIKTPNIRLLVSGKFVSILGSNIHSIVFMWLILDITESAFIASFSFVLNFIPLIIFSTYAGVLSDKYNKKNIMVISDFLSGIMAIVLGIYITNQQSPNLVIIMFISFLMSSINAFFNNASSTITPEITEDELLLVNSSIAIVVKLASVIGPLLGGLLITLVKPEVCFIINGISFIISAIFEIFIKNKATSPSLLDKKSLRQKLSLGFQTLLKNKFLLYISIIGGGIINFFLAPLSIYLALYIKNYLNLSSFNYGIIVSCITFGGILISIVLPKLKDRIETKKLVVLGFLLQGCSLVMFGFSKSIFLLALSMIVFGCSITMIGILLVTIKQQTVKVEVLGKTSAATDTICYISVPLGYLFGGLIIDYISINIVVITSGIIIICLALLQRHLINSALANNKISTELNV